MHVYVCECVLKLTELAHILADNILVESLIRIAGMRVLSILVTSNIHQLNDQRYTNIHMHINTHTDI